MAAGNLDILIEQGATFERVLTIKNSLDAPIDLTGYVFAGKVRKTVSDKTPAAVFTFTILDQGTDTGKVRMVMSSTATAAIPLEKTTSSERVSSKFLYDVEMNTGSEVIRLIQGTASVSPEVTK